MISRSSARRPATCAGDQPAPSPARTCSRRGVPSTRAWACHSLVAQGATVALQLPSHRPRSHLLRFAGPPPRRSRGGGNLPFRGHELSPLPHSPIVVLAKAGTQGRGEARGRLPLSSNPAHPHRHTGESRYPAAQRLPVRAEPLEGGQRRRDSRPVKVSRRGNPRGCPTLAYHLIRRRGDSRIARPARVGTPPMSPGPALRRAPPAPLDSCEGRNPEGRGQRGIHAESVQRPQCTFD